MSNFKKFSDFEKSSDSHIVKPVSNSSVKENKTTPEEEPIPTENDVKFYGKLARFPKKVKAHKALNFLENVKISKNSIWYILIEKQDNELQMIKYNNQKGFDMNKFVKELKTFYIQKYSDDKNICSVIDVNGATTAISLSREE